MTDANKINQATLQVHIAFDEILTDVLGREPAPYEVAQLAAIAFGEQAAFLAAHMDGDVMSIPHLDAISKAAFCEIAGPKTMENLKNDE